MGGKWVASYQSKQMSKIKYAVARALGCNWKEAGRLRYFTNPHFIRYLYYKVKQNETKKDLSNSKNKT
jgi:hypothetical protein